MMKMWSSLLFFVLMLYIAEAQVGQTMKMLSKSEGIPGGIDDLQYAYSPLTASDLWVLATGNSSAIAGIWSSFAAEGGRIVSDGDFLDTATNCRKNYAIIHAYDGPTFLRPPPMNLSELQRQVTENHARSLGLTRVCGREVIPNSGQIEFNTYWERIPTVNYRLWFPGSPSADAERAQYEQQGFRLIDLCGYSCQGNPQYVGIWQDATLSKNPYIYQYGLKLSDCLAKDRELKQQGYVAVKFQVFNSGSQVYCAAIWEQRQGCTHCIDFDQSVATMHRRILPDITMLPRQISHYYDPVDNCLKYAVLWSNTNSYRYPNPPPNWPVGLPIPKRYLPGSTSGLDMTQIAFLERRVERFMQTQDVPGLSIAVTQNECLKFAASFGWANIRNKVQLDPSHQFRIGPASVPITAAAILLLVEQGKIQLDQKVFGPGSILGTNYGPMQTPQAQAFMQTYNYVCDITVRHLLEQTTGKWAANLPLAIEPLRNNDDLIRYVVGNIPAQDMPGKQWFYSNFNYIVLSKIIECVTGQTYEQFVNSCLWNKAGVTQARVGGRFIAQRGPMEVMYYMNKQNGTSEGADPYIDIPKERVGPIGGWVVSPVDLMRLVVRLDGFKSKPDLISDVSIKSWSTPSLASNDTYGQGWFLNVNGWNGWVSVGRIPGQTSLLVRLDDRTSFVIMTNKDYSGTEYYHQLNYVMHHIISYVKNWNTGTDLFCTQGNQC